jgi:predicted O-methyltransferase YrrM
MNTGTTDRAARVLKNIEELSEREFLPIIGPHKGKYLVETLKKTGAKTILKVGTLVGYSAILMARSLPEGGVVHTIEIDPGVARVALGNIERAGLSEKIKVHIGDALSVIPKMDYRFDMLFIDAAKNEYLKYLKLAETRLKPGGAVFADNAGIFAQNMQDYLSYVRNSGSYKSEYYAVGQDGVEISVKI